MSQPLRESGFAEPRTGPPPAHLAHHFESPQQQQRTAKLGMWIFLSTEILMFGGLFCAYAIYRSQYPDVFSYAHRYLDTTLGAVNTVVLLASSLTMAWAVRCAQLGKRRGLVVTLALTLLGAVGFMTVKGIEYAHKWETGKWIGAANKYHPNYQGYAEAEPEESAKLSDPVDVAASASNALAATAPVRRSMDSPWPVPPESPGGRLAPRDLSHSRARLEERRPEAPGDEPLEYSDLAPSDRERVHVFFQIYFLMTGLHGLHVVIGMALIAWLLVKAALGAFGPQYYTPVDCIGLYWHLVDLVWIYLFPLLYLID